MEVCNWASHLEHPQSIEFDAGRVPEKPDLNQFTVYVYVLAGRTFRLGIYLRLSTCRDMRLDYPQSLQYAARKLSCRLDAINPPPLCGSQSRHWYWSGLLARWQAVTFRSVIRLTKVTGSIAKAHFQYVNKYSRKLAQWWRSDGYPPLVCH